LRFGLALPQYDYSLGNATIIGWQDVREWATKAEALGFDSVWMSDHLFFDLSKYGGSAEPQGTMEAFTSLAAIAASTQHVRLGCLVVCNDLRSPMVVAKMATTIDLISGGRFELGLGAGWYEREYAAAGITFDPAGQRVGRLEESVQIVKRSITGSDVSFEGKHYSMRGAWNTPKPARPTPVWVGGKGDRVVRVAARHADGYNCVWGWTPESYAGRMRVLDEEIERAGRSPGDVRRSVGLYTLIGKNKRDVEQTWGRYLSSSPEGTAGHELDRWRVDKLAGVPDEICERIDRFADLGVEEVILGFGILPFQIADAPRVELFAEEVISRFR
jgi:probable F420-dependent oxidoreductase